MTYSICIFLEQYYLPKRYKENIEYMIYILKKKYLVDIFSPDIDMNLNFNKNYLKILDIKSYKIKTSPTFKKNYDILIIFSDFNKKLSFDRRLLIIDDIRHKKLYTLSGYKPFEYNLIYRDQNINTMDYYLYDNLNCEKKYKFDSIFNKEIIYNKNEVNLFKKKYLIKDKIIALIPGKIKYWKDYFFTNNVNDNNEYNSTHKNLIKMFFKNLEKIKNKLLNNGYQILGIKHYSDEFLDYDFINIKWVLENEYNILKYSSEAIICLGNDSFFRYLNLKKPIISLGVFPIFYKFIENNNILKFLNNILEFYYKENNYDQLTDKGIDNFILQIINNYNFKNNLNLKLTNILNYLLEFEMTNELLIDNGFQYNVVI